MKILVIGSGGREHAIVESVAQSKKVSKIFCAPGNDGMARLCECVGIPVDDISSLVTFATQHKIALTIVGPELPLTLGIVDAFQKAGLKIFGPTQAASILEGSKIFTKEFCLRHNIPTAAHVTVIDPEEAKDYLSHQNKYPVVIKADGLAAGKGVVIAQNQVEAFEAINEFMVQRRLGGAGTQIVIEEFLVGQEASFIVVADGQDFVVFPASQDHKRIFDNDQGPNTGGMGAYAPAKLVTPKIQQKVIERIIKPTLNGMEKEGRRYTGFLYAGLMISPEGEPKLLEYNCRLGDPETEVLLTLLETDFVDLIVAALEHRLSLYQPQFKKESAVCVVLASEGYPEAPKKGDVITCAEKVYDPNIHVYHAGTKKIGENYVTNGGRVLVITALANSLQEAIERVYHRVQKISWDGMQYRKDVGQRGLGIGDRG
jgi:phosphoribosylamine--glycine ligase